MASLLFGVSARDAFTLSAVTVVLAMAALTAIVVPALRAREWIRWRHSGKNRFQETSSLGVRRCR